LKNRPSVFIVLTKIHSFYAVSSITLIVVINIYMNLYTFKYWKVY